jgi:rhamnose transport system ATP-binding protein
MTAPSPAFALRGVTKAFAGVPACTDVTLEIAAGDVVALAGENGAGKSTSMKCLYGVQEPTSGTVEIAGQAVSLSSPAEAEAAGIAMIPQDLDLFP